MGIEQLMKTTLSVAVLMGAMLAAQMPDKFGYVQTSVTPATAGVFVDGKYMGPASLYADKARAIKVAVGNHRVEIVDPYHATLVSDFQIADGQYNEIKQAMKPNGKAPKNKVSGVLTEGFGEAAVYIDDAYFGHAGRTIDVKPGKFMLKVTSMDGTILRELKVELRNRETLVLPEEGAPVVRRTQ